MSLVGPKNLARLIKEENIQIHSYIMGARLPEKVIHSLSEKIAIEAEHNLGIPFAYATERSIGKGSKINTPKEKKYLWVNVPN